MAKFSKDKLPVQTKEVSESKKNQPIKAGSVDPSYADDVTVFFNDGQNIVPLREVYSLVITEDINNIYRTGKISFEDTYDILESWSFFGLRNKETIEVSIRLSIEGDSQLLSYKFKMYNVKQSPIPASIEKSKRTIECDLIEEPIYTSFNHEVVSRSFKNMTASEIILDILTTEGGIDDKLINLHTSPNDPKIPSFIAPFWTVEKCLKYLQQYSDGGYYKVFSTYHNQNKKGVKDTYYNIVTLKGLLEGYINNLIQKDNKVVDLYLSESGNSASGYPISWYYSVTGPGHKDMRNELAGESLILFDYFTGNHEESSKVPSDIIDNLDKSTYKFDRGDDRYRINKRNYMSTLSGVYHEGVKHDSTVNNGNYLLHESSGSEHEFSTQYRKLNMDVESKRLTETKMHNRFFESYYNQLTFAVEMPGYADVQVGGVYNITLPSTVRPNIMGSEELHNEVMSGLWLHTRRVHKLRIKKGETKYKYDADAFFSKSGTELSTSLPEVKPHRKVGE